MIRFGFLAASTTMFILFLLPNFALAGDLSRWLPFRDFPSGKENLVVLSLRG
jgi:hypothetical protein